MRWSPTDRICEPLSLSSQFTSEAKNPIEVLVLLRIGFQDMVSAERTTAMGRRGDEFGALVSNWQS
jgi:hypothetical protein